MCTEFSQVIIIHLFSGVYIQQVSGGHIGRKKIFEKSCMTRGQYAANKKHTDITTSRLKCHRGRFSKTIYLSNKNQLSPVLRAERFDNKYLNNLFYNNIFTSFFFW